MWVFFCLWSVSLEVDGIHFKSIELVLVLLLEDSSLNSSWDVNESYSQGAQLRVSLMIIGVFDAGSDRFVVTAQWVCVVVGEKKVCRSIVDSVEFLCGGSGLSLHNERSHTRTHTHMEESVSCNQQFTSHFWPCCVLCCLFATWTTAVTARLSDNVLS